MRLNQYYTTMETSKKLVTHSGSFHSDDIFATVVLSFILEKAGEKFTVTRSRDPEIIQNADYVYDVGGIYDESTNRFDHHQVGGAGKDENGIEYSSFGLVWKKFGTELCGSQKVADIVRGKLVSPIDAQDNGMDLVTNKYPISPYHIQHFFSSMVPTWNEDAAQTDEKFFECVAIARTLLTREIKQAQDFLLAEEKVLAAYHAAEDKRIILLDKHYPSEYILMQFSEPLYVIYPRNDSTWGVKTVTIEPKSFKNRKDFPALWAGLKDAELQKITGVDDAVFCHRALFLCVAKSKEGALKLAQIAVENS